MEPDDRAGSTRSSASDPVVAEANTRALKAGYAFGETTEMFHTTYHVPKAKLDARACTATSPATRRPASASSTASKLARRAAVLRQLPDHAGVGHPAPAVGLQALRRQDVPGRGRDRRDRRGHRRGVRRRAGADRHVGPGLALKSEAMGLAVMVELPLVVINVQRAGPVARACRPRSSRRTCSRRCSAATASRRSRSSRRRRPASASRWRSRRARIALKYMTPVVYLSDAFSPTARSRGWSRRSTTCPTSRSRTPSRATATFLPYARDPETLARPWAVPGTPGLEHRIGGLEKADGLGNVSYDPENHHKMTLLRGAEGRPASRSDIPPLESSARTTGDLLVLGWG